MNKQRLAQLITILLLGEEDGKYLIKLWDSLIMAN